MYKTPVQYDSKECMYLLTDSYLHVQLENGKNPWCRQCLQEAVAAAHLPKIMTIDSIF